MMQSNVISDEITITAAPKITLVLLFTNITLITFASSFGLS